MAGFEPRLCELLVLELDQLFVHRARAVEGKDGNALNEVRLLCRAIMENDAVMVADKGIRLDPGRSVLGSEPGGRLALTLDGVERLRDAYFADIERKFV